VIGADVGNRGMKTAIATGVAVLIGGGAVLAATGVLPNPFDTSPIEVVESGSLEAEAAGEQKFAEGDLKPPAEGMPGWVDPFSPPPKAPVEGLPGWVDPFELPPKAPGDPDAAFEPVAPPKGPAGTGPAFERPAIRPPTPEEQAAAEAARREREAAFRAGSEFPPNPAADLGAHAFDWRIVQRIDSEDARGEFAHYVNSADGSQLFEAADLATLLGGREFPGVELHFILRKGNDDVLACGSHVDLGLACMKTGDELDGAFAWLRDMSGVTAFLDSIPGTPQTLGPGPGDGARGVRGQVSDGFLQVWVRPGPSPIATHVPWLGLGNGVLKDTRARINRQTVRVRHESASLRGGPVQLDLISMSQRVRRIDTTGYRVVTAFTGAALDEANAIGASQVDFIGQARRIEEALAACPRGRAGSECRDRYRREMKELNERFRDQALDFGRRHGLPVDD
jgi:hypothetical protein